MTILSIENSLLFSSLVVECITRIQSSCDMQYQWAPPALKTYIDFISLTTDFFHLPPINSCRLMLFKRIQCETTSISPIPRPCICRPIKTKTFARITYKLTHIPRTRSEFINFIRPLFSFKIIRPILFGRIYSLPPN